MLRTLAPGDRVMLSADAYGGTFRMLTKIFGPWGIETDVVDLSDIDAVESSWHEGTKLVWAETPSNPWLRIADIAALAEVTHRHGARLVVDNTFATPYLQTPLTLGADVVMHSTTKYLGGHSDAIGGMLVTNDAELARAAEVLPVRRRRDSRPPGLLLDHARHSNTRRSHGPTPGERRAGGRRCSSSTTRSNGSGIPGLETHPNHKVALDQMRGFGGMVSVEVAGGAAGAKAFVEKTKVFTLAESLGGVESLIEIAGADDAHVDERIAAGDPGELRAPQRRYRGRRRPARGPSPGAGLEPSALHVGRPARSIRVGRPTAFAPV